MPTITIETKRAVDLDELFEELRKHFRNLHIHDITEKRWGSVNLTDAANWAFHRTSSEVIDRLEQHLKNMMSGHDTAIDATKTAVELAEQHGVDLSKVTGTGSGGKITKPDVAAFIESSEAHEDNGIDPESD